MDQGESMTQNDAVALSKYYATMKGEDDLSVVAIAGKEGNRETYVTKVSFTDLVKHFKLIDTDSAPEGVILQRELAKSRKWAYQKIHYQAMMTSFFPV